VIEKNETNAKLSKNVVLH